MNFGKYLQRYPPINFWFCIDQNCFLLSFFYQSIKKYLNPPSKKDPLNLWNSFRYTTMLHVIKKIQQQKKNRQEIFYCVKWLSDFLQRSDLTFWLLFLLLYSILFSVLPPDALRHTMEYHVFEVAFETFMFLWFHEVYFSL